MRIAAVAFDLDGLMFNTEDLYTEVGAELVGRRGHQLDPELVSQMMGRPSSVAFPMMIEWYGLSDTVEQLDRETSELFHGLLQDRLAAMPGLRELLAYLDQAQVPRAITTSSRRWFVDRLLSIVDLQTEFDFFLTAEDVANGKPHPEIYQTAATRFGVEPHRMMVLEDSENGCRAAVGAGACTVAVPSQFSRSHRFDGVTCIADTLHDEQIYRLLAEGRAQRVTLP